MPHREKFHVETWSIVAIVQPNCVYQLIKSVPLLLLYSMQAFIKMSIMVVLLSPHTSQETPGTSLVKQSANQFFFIKFNVELCRFLGIQVATSSTIYIGVNYLMTEKCVHLHKCKMIAKKFLFSLYLQGQNHVQFI